MMKIYIDYFQSEGDIQFLKSSPLLKIVGQRIDDTLGRISSGICQSCQKTISFNWQGSIDI